MKAVLSQEVREDFELVGEHHDHVLTNWGEIRFSQLTKPLAESLVQRGYLGLRRISKPTAPSVAAEPPAVEMTSEEEDSSTPSRRKRLSKKEEPNLTEDE